MANERQTGNLMTGERFARIVEAYGADSNRWPAEERTEAERFAEMNPQFCKNVLSEAATVDTLLDSVPPPRLSPDARTSLTRSIRPGPLATLKSLLDWQGALWQPAGALAAALFLGIGLGVTSPDNILLPIGGATVAAETGLNDTVAAEMATDMNLFLYGPAEPVGAASGAAADGAGTETAQ